MDPAPDDEAMAHDVIAAELADVVAPALGRPTPKPGEWDADLIAQPAAPGLATVGIWRVSARDSSWSVVLKVLRHVTEGPGSAWSSHDDPHHPFYWRREADALTSDLLARLDCGGGGLRAPRCHGVVERTDGSAAVWMEDVVGEPGTGWSLPRYRQAAEHLGSAQARWAAGDLSGRWLSRGWLRTYLDRRGSSFDGVLDDPDGWRHPLVKATLPVERAPEFRQLWADRARFLTTVQEFPETLCQLDFHPGNLFDVDGRTVVIDWAFAGIGHLGEDAGALVVDVVTDFHLEPADLGQLFDIVVEGYADGLSAGGLRLPIGKVRRAVAAGAVARYGWLAPALVSWAASGRPTMNGRPTEEAAKAWGTVAVFLLDQARLVLR
jgi:Phosphotransferase enzyme family